VHRIELATKMRIDPSDHGAEQIYRLMTGIVVPRPIAWVTSLSAAGVLNLAPFSAFTFVSQKPPMLAISVGRKGDVFKDTAARIGGPRYARLGDIVTLQTVFQTAKSTE
jgi:hypothetical protein